VVPCASFGIPGVPGKCLKLRVALHSTPTRFRHNCLVPWNLEENEAAKDSNKPNGSGITFFGGASDNQIVNS
jgi:hypothetical protein